MITNEQYRAAAIKLMTKTPLVHDVSHFAHVHPADGGAFVEVVIWVPQDEVDGVAPLPELARADGC